MAESLAFTFTAEGVVVKVFASQVDGGVQFRFETTAQEGYRIDLNGFFLDLGGDGGTVSFDGSKANNMNGGNNDGYDYSAVLGSIGGNDADYVSGTIVIPRITLADLEGADAGLRATSYGLDGQGSLKLVADYEPPPPPPEDNFPLFPQDISNVVFFFEPINGGGDTNGDGYYLVKIDEVPKSAPDDLDDWYMETLAWLIANDPNVQSADQLLGAAIKGGTQDTLYYALDGDLDADPFPVSSGSGPGGNVPPADIDMTYNYDEIFS
ncbi:hypothetical protein [Falsiroseomonas sp.]|uniref:hypothetical protein n=1 Tax=Falsiroseomonas sp. TaxID=2870721 RepID=UPI0027166D65|nr:hypothetical protein [Falsiroseomonas sp.]MDO9503211.1 hypothetical protein [Falsiroseomonas sp.]